ncbi:unnamed protein product [Effrenium voratum]|uniref:protein-tyrosine-phosphatase n=1 Tax=Effrenium voratum TaxID=2562239 RepID=A0AA36N7C7_9DINO|nr:unnamed protein product [Effrenium voratum]
MDEDEIWCQTVGEIVRATMKPRERDHEAAKLTDWGLFIGGLREAQDLSALQRLGISAVLNAAPDVVHVEYPEHWRVLVIEAEDDVFYPLLDTHMDAVLEFLDTQHADGRKVLVHCFAGMNRSAALCAAYLMIRDRMGLAKVVRHMSEQRGWILSNEGFVHQLVRLAREEDLLEPPEPRQRLDSVEEENGAKRMRARTSEAATCHASKLGRSLSRLSSMSDVEEEDLKRTKARLACKLDRKYSRSTSGFSDVSDASPKIPRTTTQPRSCRTISDKDMGYASRLPRQDSVSADLKKIKPLKDLREGSAKLQDGTYLYVIMIGDPEYIRLIHEEHLVNAGVLGGHTSLVERNEFMRGWARQWESNDPQVRHTVLYAGELNYKEGEGVLMWNNHSGHYTPAAEDHVRVHLDPSTFVAFDED